MDGRKKLIYGGLAAGGLMLGAAGLVIGAGIAKADPYTVEDVPGYLAGLDAEHLHSGDPDKSVAFGRHVCVLIRREGVYQAAIDAHYEAFNSLDTSLRITNAAWKFLCPDAAPGTPVLTTTPLPDDPGSVRGAICDSLGIPRVDRGPFGNPCPAGS
jgi:hypothetical protein